MKLFRTKKIGFHPTAPLAAVKQILCLSLSFSLVFNFSFPFVRADDSAAPIQEPSTDPNVPTIRIEDPGILVTVEPPPDVMPPDFLAEMQESPLSPPEPDLTEVPMELPGGSRQWFDDQGRLIKKIDAQGNVFEVDWEKRRATMTVANDRTVLTWEDIVADEGYEAEGRYSIMVWYYKTSEDYPDNYNKFGGKFVSRTLDVGNDVLEYYDGIWWDQDKGNLIDVTFGALSLVQSARDWPGEMDPVQWRKIVRSDDGTYTIYHGLDWAGERYEDSWHFLIKDGNLALGDRVIVNRYYRDRDLTPQDEIHQTSTLLLYTLARGAGKFDLERKALMAEGGYAYDVHNAENPYILFIDGIGTYNFVTGEITEGKTLDDFINAVQSFQPEQPFAKDEDLDYLIELLMLQKQRTVPQAEMRELEEPPVISSPLTMIQNFRYHPFSPNISDTPSYERFTFRTDGLPHSGVLILAREGNAIPEVLEGQTAADIEACKDPLITFCLDIELQEQAAERIFSITRAFFEDANKKISLADGSLLMVDLFYGGFTAPEYSPPYRLPDDFSKSEVTSDELAFIEKILKENESKLKAKDDLANRFLIDPSEIEDAYQRDVTFNRNYGGYTGREIAIWEIGFNLPQKETGAPPPIRVWEEAEFHYVVRVYPDGTVEVKLTNPERTLQELKAQAEAVYQETADRVKMHLAKLEEELALLKSGFDATEEDDAKIRDLFKQISMVKEEFDEFVNRHPDIQFEDLRLAVLNAYNKLFGRGVNDRHTYFLWNQWRQQLQQSMASLEEVIAANQQALNELVPLLERIRNSSDEAEVTGLLRELEEKAARLPLIYVPVDTFERGGFLAPPEAQLVLERMSEILDRMKELFEKARQRVASPGDWPSPGEPIELTDGHLFIFDSNKTGRHIDENGSETGYVDIVLIPVEITECPTDPRMGAPCRLESLDYDLGGRLEIGDFVETEISGAWAKATKFLVAGFPKAAEEEVIPPPEVIDPEAWVQRIENEITRRLSEWWNAQPFSEQGSRPSPLTFELAEGIGPNQNDLQGTLLYNGEILLRLSFTSDELFDPEQITILSSFESLYAQLAKMRNLLRLELALNKSGPRPKICPADMWGCQWTETHLYRFRAGNQLGLVRLYIDTTRGTADGVLIKGMEGEGQAETVPQSGIQRIDIEIVDQIPDGEDQVYQRYYVLKDQIIDFEFQRSFGSGPNGPREIIDYNWLPLNEIRQLSAVQQEAGKLKYELAKLIQRRPRQIRIHLFAKVTNTGGPWAPAKDLAGLLNQSLWEGWEIQFQVSGIDFIFRYRDGQLEPFTESAILLTKQALLSSDTGPARPLQLTNIQFNPDIIETNDNGETVRLRRNYNVTWRKGNRKYVYQYRFVYDYAARTFSEEVVLVRQFKA